VEVCGASICLLARVVPCTVGSVARLEEPLSIKSCLRCVAKASIVTLSRPRVDRNHIVIAVLQPQLEAGFNFIADTGRCRERRAEYSARRTWN
jgi:hypothetical protein